MNPLLSHAGFALQWSLQAHTPCTVPSIESISMKWILVCGGLLGAAAVMSGAFGAHALQGVLGERARGWFDTAVTYHAQHALALVATGLLAGFSSSQTGTQIAAACFLSGIVLFSGSLYLMAFTGWTKLGMITPIGGVFLIAGWLAFAFSAAKLANAHP